MESTHPLRGKRLFITGIPTAGKSYLAKAVAAKVAAKVVHFDKVLDNHLNDPLYEKWINFYWNQDERAYLTGTSPDDQRRFLMEQAECFWPLFKEHIDSYKDEMQPVIFESVSLFPSLVRRAFDFPGIVLAGVSIQETLKRNQGDPRWSKLPELQAMEAEAFFNIERPLYISEAKKIRPPGL